MSPLKNKKYKSIITRLPALHSYAYYLVQLKDTHHFDLITDVIASNPNEVILNKAEKESLLHQIHHFVIYGSKMNIYSVFHSNALNILNNCAVDTVLRIERFIICPKEDFDEAMIDSMTMDIFDSLPKIFKQYSIDDISLYPQVSWVKNMEEFNEKQELAFDQQDLSIYKNYFKEIGRFPTNMELFDLSQSNSEHSRHGFFNAILTIQPIKGKSYNSTKSLFDYIKEPLKRNDLGSLVAFKDNSSVIKGYPIHYLYVDKNKYLTKNTSFDLLLTAETHNFPTGIAPFEGAATGVGGRLRDVYATGRGGLMLAGTAGYCVGNLYLENYKLDYEGKYTSKDKYLKGWKILIQASNGASDYGNKIGEPLILGFCRSYGKSFTYQKKENTHTKHFEWIKPIMFSGGIGMISSLHIFKEKVLPGMRILRAGGPAYRIGIGGGAASSIAQDSSKNTFFNNAVQRGNPQMQNRLYKFLRNCIEQFQSCPILVLHDQGAGGVANVTKEIMDNCGGRVDLVHLQLGDETLSSIEKWISEFQESVTFLVKEKNIQKIVDIAKLENVCIEELGVITNTGKVEVRDSSKEVQKYNLEVIESEKNKKLGNILEFDIEKMNNFKRKQYRLEQEPMEMESNSFIQAGQQKNIEYYIEKLFSLVSVGSKRFLVNKVDRSVGGLVAQQQTCGYSQIPVSDYALTLLSYADKQGIATSIGERPINSLFHIQSMVDMTIGEMLTNLVFVKIRSFEEIKCSGNWMWAPKVQKEGYKLYEAVKRVNQILIELGIAIDGGKDSLSMCTKTTKNNYILSPPTLVLSSYVGVNNVDYRLTPDLKKVGNRLLFIDLGWGMQRLTGSAFHQVFNQIGLVEGAPIVEKQDWSKIKKVFQIVQKNIEDIFLRDKLIYSGHDRSDGGLITTLLEMAFSGNCGIKLDLEMEGKQVIDFLFNEELGLVLEVDKEKEHRIIEELSNICPVYSIGEVIYENKIHIRDVNGGILLDRDMPYLRQLWETTSFELEKKQTDRVCVEQEMKHIYTRKKMDLVSPVYDNYVKNHKLDSIVSKKRVGIVREEGSNGEREMAFCFQKAGFQVYDLNTKKLLEHPSWIREMDILAFVGGFSYSDTFGSATGWYHVLKSHPKLYQELILFRADERKYALGICNGFQLLALLGWFGDIGDLLQKKIPHQTSKKEFDFTVKLEKNVSGRFESRFIHVRIDENNSVFLKNMEQNILGVWSSHAEGRICFYRNGIPIDSKEELDLIGKYVPIKYIDDQQKSTEKYPFNPNGSLCGYASLSSVDGRVLGMMPHADRSFLKNHWAYTPTTLFDNDVEYSPWFIMFLNAMK